MDKTAQCSIVRIINAPPRPNSIAGADPILFGRRPLYDKGDEFFRPLISLPQGIVDWLGSIRLRASDPFHRDLVAGFLFILTAKAYGHSRERLNGYYGPECAVWTQVLRRPPSPTANPTTQRRGTICTQIQPRLISMKLEYPVPTNSEIDDIIIKPLTQLPSTTAGPRLPPTLSQQMGRALSGPPFEERDLPTVSRSIHQSQRSQYVGWNLYHPRFWTMF